MASAILHIKDSYYFDVPKALWRSGRQSVEDFPDVWVRADSDFLYWQTHKLYESLQDMPRTDLPSLADLEYDLAVWVHADHAHAGAPLTRHLAESESAKWFRSKVEDSSWVGKHGEWLGRWEAATATSGTAGVEAYREEMAAGHVDAWAADKVAGYNQVLHGKILIPQPFGTLRNLYQSDAGFCISKFMVIQFVVAVIIVAMFCGYLAPKIRNGDAPRGRLWNLLEVFLLFLRDEVIRPAIGHGADRFAPLLWSVFFFILGCNLFGMLPWAGAPTSAFGVTIALAAVTLVVGWGCGVVKFGPQGVFYGQLVPGMELPIYMAIILMPMIWVIEVVGNLIKHGVLGVRLLANMVAGHVVLLGILGIAFSVEGALGDFWGLAAVISLVGGTLIACLELFVAFLQAYIFTFLSALFIGAATHKH